MKNKAFNSFRRFGKWMRKYHLGRSICKVLGVQAHMRQVQRRVSGRSMIEMLGVLAIIGVLSIGGLYAYRQAMMKNESNQLLNDIFIRAQMCSEQVSLGAQNCLLSELPNPTSTGYIFSSEVWGNRRYFNLIVSKSSGIPKAVCRDILQKEWTLPQIYKGDKVGTVQVTIADCTTTDLTLTFVFEKDLQPIKDASLSDEGDHECETDQDCSLFCQKCQNGVCSGGCDASQKEQCYMGNCVVAACTLEAGCTPPQVCRVMSNPANNACKLNECNYDSDCQDPAKPYCDVGNGGGSGYNKCVTCRSDEDCIDRGGYCYSDGSCKAPPVCANPASWYQTPLNCTCEDFEWNGIACCPTDKNTTVPFSSLSVNQCALCGGRIIGGICTRVDCTVPKTQAECESCDGIWIDNQCQFNACQDNSTCTSGQYCGGATSNFIPNYTGCVDANYTIAKIYYNNEWEKWARFNNSMSYWDGLMACAMIGGRLPSKDDVVGGRWRMLGQVGWQDWVWTTHVFGGGNNDVAGLMNGGTYNTGRGDKYIVICHVQ